MLDEKPPLCRGIPECRRGRIRDRNGLCPGIDGPNLDGHGCSLPRHDGADARQPTARSARDGHVAVGDLRRACLVPQLAGRFDQEKDASHPRVAGRQSAAVGVEGEVAAASEMPLGDVRAALALLAEAEALEQEQHGDREAVVELHRVDFGRRQAGLGQGGRAAGGRRRRR